MKCVILAGGKGTRMGDTEDCPKSMVRIGGHPLGWFPKLSTIDALGWTKMGYLTESKRDQIERDMAL